MQVCTPLRPAPSFKLGTLWVDHTDTLYSYLHFQVVSPAPIWHQSPTSQESIQSQTNQDGDHNTSVCSSNLNKEKYSCIYSVYKIPMTPPQ